MKLPLLLLSCLGLVCLSLAMPKPAAALKAGSSPLPDTIPARYFIADSFFTKYDLYPKSTDNPFMHVWSNPDKKSRFSTVNDIRLRFNNKHAAATFFKKNLQSNAEGAVEIHPGITIPGTQELHVYKESDQMAMQNKTQGYNLRYYFFLFLVNNVYVKVFVAANIDTTVQDASVFAVEASKTMQAALLKK